MVKINGNPEDADGKVLRDYLIENEYPLTRIAVEKNGEIVPKAQYGEAVLYDGDTVEIVCFVGGG